MDLTPSTILHQTFGYERFRPNQEEVISAILSGQDVFTAMPTGGGKSLCYQIPAMIFEGLTVVISPLIALMKDQVDEARARGIAAEYLNSSLSPGEAAEIYQKLEQGDVKLLYIAPERLALEGYFSKLRDFNVSFFAIDEAHCLSEWGHDFRPDYLILSDLRLAFRSTPIAAFTATATREVQEDIIRILSLDNPYIVRASFNRKELHYQVKPKSKLLDQIYAAVKDRVGEQGIIYRLSRKDTEKTAMFLQAKGIRALPYHAGMSKDERTFNQDEFNRDEIQVIVATTAFGMGINKNNIRFVIHGDLPKSIEGYYQETGRAGRDGLDSDCILFFSSGDIVRQQYFIDQIEDEDEKQRCKDNLNIMARFASVHVCRRKQLLEYFGEKSEDDCGSCDVCNDSREKISATRDAQMILSAMARTQERFGLSHIIDIVWGAKTEKIRQRNHDELPTFGVGKDKPKKWWRSIVEELIGQEKIFQDSDFYNVLKMTEQGREVLFGREDFFISEVTAAKAVDSTEKKTNIALEGNTELLSHLKEKRTELAREMGVPPYIVFSDKTLQHMAAIMPGDSEEFLTVSGVGEKKLESFGDTFLQVISDYKQRN
jgi:ATP-dependent DNA helicase RecQ